MNASMKQLRPLVSFEERIEEISGVLSDMQICLDRQTAETKELKIMLGRLKQMLDDITCK